MNCTLNGFDGVGLAREDDLVKRELSEWMKLTGV